MIKILRWNVLIRNNANGYFMPVAYSRYLSGICTDHALSYPVWDDDPIFYSIRESRFLVSQLRKAGFSVYRLPAVFYMLRAYRIKKKSASWK